MLTYYIWKGFIDEFNRFTNDFTKIGTYSFLSFISIITILLDILTSPFQIIGIIIWLITRRKK